MAMAKMALLKLTASQIQPFRPPGPALPNGRKRSPAQTPATLPPLANHRNPNDNQPQEPRLLQFRPLVAGFNSPGDTHERYLADLTELRDELKTALSGRKSDAGLTAGDLSQQIKALKASQTIEAAPQRAGQRSVTAAEPVTTRIRKRAQGTGDSDAVIPPGADKSETAPYLRDKATWLSIAEKLADLDIQSSYTNRARPGPPQHEMTHRQRLAMERRRDDPEQTRS
jgi:hypothetical protein